MMKYFTLTVFSLLTIYQTAFAQFEFNNDNQRFEPQPVNLPYIGFDLLRDMFPDILVQTPDQKGGWKDMYRAKSYKQNDRYTDIGWYLFDSVKQRWVESIANRYTNTFQGAQLNSSVWVYYYNDMQFKHKKRCRIFYKNGKADSLIYEKADSQNGQNYSMEETHRFIYDAQGRLIQSKLLLANGIDFTKNISYNSLGQVISSLSLYKAPGSSTLDSSTWLRYEYNAQGKLSYFSRDFYFGSWFNDKRIEYEYDASGRLSHNKAWYQDGPQLINTLRIVSDYTYNSSGQIASYRHWWLKPEGDSTESKIIFQYDGTQLKFGYEYYKKNNVFDTVPGARYFFHQNLPLSVQPAQLAAPFHLYPNPAQNYLNFNTAQKGVFKIYDLRGRLLKEWESAQDLDEIYIGELEKGAYLLHLNQAVYRFIKN